MMMMMSSNTVGNHDFNTAGITPFDAKKPQAKKESPVKLAAAKADSFTKVHPRDVAEVDSTPVAAVQPSGNKAGLVGTILGGLGTIVGGVALYFALSKGDAAEVATKAAEAAKKEATELRAKVENLGKGLTLEEIEEKIQKGVEEGINAIKTAGGKTLNELEQDVDNVADGAKNYTDDLRKKVGVDINAIRGKLLNQEAHNEQTNTAIEDLELELQNLRALVNPQVAGKDVSKDVLALFKPTENPANFAETAFAKAVVEFEDKTKKTTSLPFMREGLAMLDDHPGSIQTLIANFPLAQPDHLDSYTIQFNNLRSTLTEINDVFTGKTELKDSWLQNGDKQLLEKTQAVVDAAGTTPESLEAVKKAQTELVEALKETFGKTKTERFKVDYPHAVLAFDPPAEGSTHAWVRQYFNPETSFDDMAKVITEAGQGLDGTKANNTHKNADALQVVLPNLANALAKAYPDKLKISPDGVLALVEDVPQSDALSDIKLTLNSLKVALQPITENALEADTYGLFRETSTSDLTARRKLMAEMINERLKGNTSGIESITEKMYNLLRTDLQALNEAKASSPAQVAG